VRCEVEVYRIRKDDLVKENFYHFLSSHDFNLKKSREKGKIFENKGNGIFVEMRVLPDGTGLGVFFLY
jgi:hypothetical protein